MPGGEHSPECPAVVIQRVEAESPNGQPLPRPSEWQALKAEVEKWMLIAAQRGVENALLREACVEVLEWWDGDGPHRAEPDFVAAVRKAMRDASAH